MAFRTISKLNDFIKEYQNRVSIERQKEITVREVMNELGDYAEISWNTVKQFKNKDMQPSLSVAIRIAEFFNTNVENIWTVEHYESIVEEVKPKQKVQKEKPKCKHENCFNESIARGFCNKHYQQFRNHNPEKFNTENPTECTEEGCTNPYHAKGLCAIHYNKFYRESRIKK
jgi:DNA-binding XRE family transcriptional regulator